MFVKSIDSICARERPWLKPKAEEIEDSKGKQEGESRPLRKQLIIMICDKGMDVDSRIKRRLRYGSAWKQDSHAHYTAVSINNKNNTTQTCIYGVHTSASKTAHTSE
ncbi:hypothetical protein EDC96DRAFT_71037 [Choanephora cucurbitarum]|nr:hypothetical protein EDC96DRAFT_71037 [Choanephora cucurbitarum]